MRIEAKGTVKEIAGRVTGDNELEYKGKAEKQGDKAELGYGDLKTSTK
ncbi:CsbD family protein [Halomonas sp. LR5S13]|nr:CsbD family protein [Halomonas rhizosphaerae]